jgi:hypothetical protein
MAPPGIEELESPFSELCLEKPMMRLPLLLLISMLAIGPSAALAQAKKTAPAGKMPVATDNSIAVTVFLRDAGKNEVLLATRVWPGYPEYNAVALQRFFAVMKAFEPAYKQDDDVAYSWAQKAKVSKCEIYLESWDAGVKGGTGATVGCEANGVSGIAVTSAADPKRPSASGESKHLESVMDLVKKQMERAKGSVAKWLEARRDSSRPPARKAELQS